MSSIPKIRFKGFTDDWKKRKLGEIITEYKETVDSDCTLPILTSSKTEGVILQEEHFGRKQQHDITGYNILPRNYCTYRNRSDGVDFTFNINKCCDKGIISKFYPVFSGKNSDVFFLSLVLNNSDEVVREIAYTCTGTGQKVLSFLDLQKMKVRVPSFDEQKEIATYFDTFDHLITLQQQKCKDIKLLKKYMLQKMFPQKGRKVPEIRFKEYAEDWEQRKLEDVLEVLKDGTHGTHADVDNGVYLLSAKNIKNGCVSIDENDRQISVEEYEKIHIKFKLKNGDVLMTIVGTIGESAVLESAENITFQRSVAFLRPNNELLNSFLFQTIYTKSFQKELDNRKATGAQPGIYLGEVAQIPIMIPTNISEQAKISSCLTNLDHLIALHQRKCNELKELKKYMLQNMFPQKG